MKIYILQHDIRYSAFLHHVKSYIYIPILLSPHNFLVLLL